MNNKRATLSILAFAIAIGSAFASLSPVQNAWIKISLTGSGYFMCVDTNFQCDEGGPAICKVDVVTVEGLVTVSGKGQFFCSATLNSNTNMSVGLYSPLFGLIQSAE